MTTRRALPDVLDRLASFPAVALLGPRQCGKTTLALEIAGTSQKPATYLDLERDSDLAKLGEAELFLATQSGRLLILDEIQRHPNLFPLLRSEIDRRSRAGERAGQFLVLGSASRDLLRQSSESLAGRIAYLELAPFTCDEVGARDDDLDRLWVRGGFPRSYLAPDDEQSFRWRGEFISTYLERDIPLLGPRLPAELMRRFWTLLAFGQGTQLNAARLASNLSISGQSVKRWLDVLTDLYMVRQLPVWTGATSRRLVKAPKVYVRDSGLVHRLTNLPDLDTLLGHPLCGESWEGFAIEQILVRVPDTWTASYYRTSAGAEIDLVLEGPRNRVVAVEIKRTSTPKASAGFLRACEDIGATERWYVTPRGERFPLGHGVQAIGLADFAV
ncbi:MAG: ATP-binding protein [Planctomycetes bacterium]|nr:ATP-binding protein [Planctomycetota bacterium]